MEENKKPLILLSIFAVLAGALFYIEKWFRAPKEMMREVKQQNKAFPEAGKLNPEEKIHKFIFSTQDKKIPSKFLKSMREHLTKVAGSITYHQITLQKFEHVLDMQVSEDTKKSDIRAFSKLIQTKLKIPIQHYEESAE